MVKLKTNPNQGTRTIHLPFVGDTKFTDGETEMSEENFQKLNGIDFGFKLVGGSGQTKEKADKLPGEKVGGQAPADDLPPAMDYDFFVKKTVKEMLPFFEELKSEGLISETDAQKYSISKKEEKAQFLADMFEALNNLGDEPEEEEEEETEEEETEEKE